MAGPSPLMESPAVLDYPGLDRADADARRAHPIEGSPPSPVVSIAPIGWEWDPGPAKAKKGKKGRKRERLQGADAQGDTKGRGHAKKVRGETGETKKAKGTKRLAAGLQALGGTLSQLRDRLADLHSIQLDQAESTEALSRRVGALDALTAAERERGERLVGRLDQLSQSLESLAARLDAEPPQIAALDDLAGRIARAEANLDRVQERVLGAEPANRVLGELEGRLAALQVLLDAQGGRLERLGLQVQVAQGQAEQRPWQEPMEVLQRSLDARLRGLEEGLRQTQGEAIRAAADTRGWTRDRLTRLGRRGTLALGLLGVLVAGFVAVLWYQGDQLAAGTAARLEGREPRLVVPAPAEPAPTTPANRELMESLVGPLTERLGRLESGLGESDRDLAAARQVAEEGRGKLAELGAGQQALTQRLDTLQHQLFQTDTGLVALEERIGALSPTRRAASSFSPVSAGPTPLDASSYGVQLIAYQSRSRIAPFVEQHGIGDQALITEGRLGGRTGYAVLLGPYGSASEAEQALAALPPPLRALGPWVRHLPSGTQLQPWR